MTDTRPRPSGSPRPATTVAATVVLGVGAALVGTLGWAVPRRSTSGWQVTAVPAELLAVLLATAAVCAAVAAVLTRPARFGPAVAVTWWALTAAAGSALVWEALYLASLRDDGGVIPVLDWLPTFVPALLVGVVARRHGRAAHLRATTGIAVATLPLSALGWALSSGEGTGVALAGAIWSTGLLGAVPLAVAVLLTRVRRPGSPAAHHA